MKHPSVFGAAAATGAVVASGAIAGLMFGVGIEALPANAVPPRPGFGTSKQATRCLDAMPPVSTSTLLSLLAAAALSDGRGRRWYASAAALAVTTSAVTLVKEIPLNRKITSWDPEAAPHGWMAVRDQWFRNHLVRSVPAVLSFGCAVAGLFQRRQAR